MLVYGRSIHFYEIFKLYPKLYEPLYSALRFINYTYKGFVKILPCIKIIYDFAVLINVLDDGNLKDEKKDILDFLRVEYPEIINKINEKSNEILN